jgi:hypothetical protein
MRDLLCWIGFSLIRGCCLGVGNRHSTKCENNVMKDQLTHKLWSGGSVKIKWRLVCFIHEILFVTGFKLSSFSKKNFA